MESSRTVTNKPNSRMAALKKLLTEAREYGMERDYANFPSRGETIRSSQKTKEFPQGANKDLCDNVGTRFKNGHKKLYEWAYEDPGNAQYRPEVIAANLTGKEYGKPRNTFLITKKRK